MPREGSKSSEGERAITMRLSPEEAALVRAMRAQDRAREEEFQRRKRELVGALRRLNPPKKARKSK